MKEKNLGELKNAGINRYVDRHGRTLLVNRKKKIAYIIDKNARRKDVIFSNRLVLAIIVGVFAGSKNVALGIGLGIAVAIILEIAYHQYYLKSLQTIELEDLPEGFSFMNNAIKQSKFSNISLAVLGIAIPVLLAVNAVQTVKDWQAVLSLKDINGLILVIASVRFGLFTIFVGYNGLTAYLAKRKGE